MPDYKAPLRDMRFVLNEVLDLDGHYAKLGLEEVNSELLNAFLEEGAKFAETGGANGGPIKSEHFDTIWLAYVVAIKL